VRGERGYSAQRAVSGAVRAHGSSGGSSGGGGGGGGSGRVGAGNNASGRERGC
jgi:hypothetical protein